MLTQDTDEITDDHQCGFQHNKSANFDFGLLGLLSHEVFWLYTNISEEHAASIFRVVTLDLHSEYLSRYWLQ
jgi:hypothetical protein